MEIKQQYVVDGQCFDTIEEAQHYIDTNKDLQMVNAFAEYKRGLGAQRVNTAIIEEFLAWVKTKEQESSEPKAETETTEGEETEETPPWTEPGGEEQPEKVEKKEEAPPLEEPKKKETTSIFG